MTKIYLKYVVTILMMALLMSCSATKDFSEYENSTGILIETGVASWYGPNFNGKRTANGEIFNMRELTAAHRTLPFNSIVKVKNTFNNRSVIVRINDRGPFAKSRIIDLSREAATRIGMINDGSAEVELVLLKADRPIPEELETPHYSVQVGSYNAQKDAKKLSSTIADSRIVEAIVNDKVFFRVYVGLYTDISEAETKKDELKDQGINGFVKQIEN